MKNRKIIGLVGVLALTLIALFFVIFEQKEVLDVKWNADYKYENKEPHGAWLLTKILENVYGKEQVIKLNQKNYIPDSKEGKRKGYLIIGDYLSFEKRKVDQLSDFVKQGNDAIIIASDLGYYIDTLFQPYFNTHNIEDSIVYLTNPEDNHIYELSYYYLQMDSASNTFHYVLDSLEKNPAADISTLSYLNDSLPIFVKLGYGDGAFFIHTIPDAFSNIGITQSGMHDYTINTLPILQIDTLFLDHNSYNQNWTNNDSPIQFIMTQPPLKWAYFISMIGLLLFVISRGKRKQRILPILPLKENTSLEFIETLSELYRSQSQHHKLATHLKTIFTQWIKKKYYLSPDDPKYVVKIAQKSKIHTDNVQSIINRLNAAIGNNRFDQEQLTNLYKDLNQFYKNCQ